MTKRKITDSQRRNAAYVQCMNELKSKRTMQLNGQQQEALRKVLDYLSEEEDDYDDTENHIYTSIKILEDMLTLTKG